MAVFGAAEGAQSSYPALYGSRVRQPSYTSKPLGTIAVALVLALARLALVRSCQFTTNSLTYIASQARPCIFDSGASLHTVPDVFDVGTGQYDWWWRENAAQAA